MTEVADADAGVGEQLARARAALGFSVADVAQQLKFASRQIEDLEQGRYERLPAGTFARGMVRAYARLLKLDPGPLVEGIAGRVAVPDNADAVVSARRPIPITDHARRGNLIYAALSVLILGVIVAVVFEWQRERSAPAPLAFVPTQAAPAAPQPLAAASGVTPPNLQPMTGSEPVEAVVPAPPVAAATSIAAAAAAASAQAATSTTSAAPGRHRITMKFERTSWVEIRGGDGKVLLSQLNRGGSEQTVDGRPPFALVIGNAQYVRLSYDERQVDLSPYVKVEVARFTLD